MELDRLLVFRLRMSLHGSAAQYRTDSWLVHCWGGRKPNRGQNSADPIEDRKANRVQMILQLERLEEIAFNIDIATKIGFHKAQAISPKHHCPHHARAAADECKWRFRNFRP